MGRLVASFDVGKRYVRKYRDGRTEIGLTPKTIDPRPAQVVDEKPMLARDQEAVKLPLEQWEILEDRKVKVAYEVRAKEAALDPVGM